MSQTAAAADPLYAADRERPPAGVVGPWAWARAHLFGSWWSTAITLMLGYLIVRFALELRLMGFRARRLERAI